MAVTTQKTFCRICEAQCGLVVHTDDGVVTKIEPNEDHVASKGYACIKGLRMGDFAQTPDRLTQPLKKVNGKFEPISWDKALQEIAERLNAIHAEHGGEAIAAYMGNPIGFSIVPSMMMSFFVTAFGADKLFTPGTQDCASKFAGGQLLYGGPNEQTFPDIDHCKTLIVIGSNPLISKSSFISLPHPMKRIKAIEDRGGKVYWVNPRKTESANRCGEQVYIRPDTDVFMLLGWLNEIVARGGVNQEWVEQHAKGYQELTRLVADWPLSKVAQVTQIPAEQLGLMLDSYLEADGAAIYHSTGVNQGSWGVMCYWLQESINLITGNLDKRGGVLAGKAVVPGQAEQTETKRSRIANVPYVNSTIPAGIMADEILTPGKGQVRAMFNMAGNPLLSCSDSARLGEAFEQLDLFVYLDIVRNETAEYADYILPGLHQLERADIPFYFFTMMGVMPTRYFGYTDPVIDPPGDARDENLVLRQICRLAGKPINQSSALQALSNLGERLGKLSLFKNWPSFDQWALSLMARGGKLGGLKALRASPDGILLEPNKPGDYLGQRVKTKDGKIDIAPAELIARGYAEFEATFQTEMDKQNQLKMIQKRERYTHNSWAHNVADFVKGDRNQNYLYIHPQDAQTRGLDEGAMASISANNQTVVAPIKLDDAMMPGSVALPHGWGHTTAEGLSIAKTTGGVNANLITPSGPSSLEPISGMSHMNGFYVDVSAA